MAGHRTGPTSDEFVALYRTHVAFVWRILSHYGVREMELEDATQDVFIVVHRRWQTLHDNTLTKAWLYGIARRVGADRRRALGRHQRKLDALPLPQLPDFEARAADRELVRILERALAELPEDQREAFLLVEVEGLTTREVGELLNANRNTVASRLRAARAHVKTALSSVTSGAKTPLRQRRHG